MKKVLLIVLVTMLLTGLSATASLAFRPGCDGKRSTTSNATDKGSKDFDDNTFFGMQEGRAQAIRTRDRATERELGHQNDNGPGMTCFDHAMALTSRLGQLFSDIVPKTKIPAASERAFGISTYPKYGSDQWLMTALDVVVEPTLAAHADDFAPNSLSYMLGATSFPFWGSFMNTINGFIAQIMGFVNQITYYINLLNNLWTYFQQIVDALNGQMPLWISTWVPIIVNFWNNVVLPMINNTIGNIMAQVGGIVNQILGQVMAALGSLTGFMTPNASVASGKSDCARIQNLWGVGGGDPVTLLGGAFNFMSEQNALRALTGSGVQTGNAYFSFAEMVLTGGNPASLVGAPGGAAKDFLDELKLPQPALNNDMITRAMTNLTGPLSGPSVGTLKSWTTPPAGYTSGAQSALNIIGAM